MLTFFVQRAVFNFFSFVCGDEMSSSSSFPSELTASIAEFDAKVSSVQKEVVKPLTKGQSRPDLVDPLGHVNRAKVDLVSALSVNSLAWIWLKTQGSDPKQTEVKGELDRVRSAIQRLREVEVKLARKNKVDKEAAKRFVTSGLWKPGDKKVGKPDKRDQDDQPKNKKKKFN